MKCLSAAPLAPGLLRGSQFQVCFGLLSSGHSEGPPLVRDLPASLFKQFFLNITSQ